MIEDQVVRLQIEQPHLEIEQRLKARPAGTAGINRLHLLAFMLHTELNELRHTHVVVGHPFAVGRRPTHKGNARNVGAAVGQLITTKAQAVVAIGRLLVVRRQRIAEMPMRLEAIECTVTVTQLRDRCERTEVGVAREPVQSCCRSGLK